MLFPFPSIWLYLVGFACAQAQDVTVQLKSGTIITGRSGLGVDTFNGIPYADPPVGQLRMRPPVRLSRKMKAIDARGIAAACPQQIFSPADRDALGKVGSQILSLPFLKDVQGQEDCLTVSVQRPFNTKPGDKLPVVVWIYGGGFTLGSTNTYDATSLLRDAVAQNQPFVFVAINYRLGAFGFMPGADIKREGSANAGLLDQRMGLEWVADNIAHFGGDPDKVTLWGESAGSMSVFFQMALFGGNATYNGKPLFRSSIMNSGTTAPAGAIDGAKGQAAYDQVVKEAGCSGSGNDTLSCLRNLDYGTFYKAVTETFPGIFSFFGNKITFLPRADGHVLPLSPDELAATGQYHAVPLILGDQEDEGTIFSIFQSSIKTDDDFVNYLSENLFADATKDQLSELVGVYTKDKEGSPFRSSPANTLYPMFRKIAAILGDVTFTLSRRIFLETTTKINPHVPTWSYLSSYAHPLPIIGTFHGSDLLQVFAGLPDSHATRSTRQYYFNFFYNQDPNEGNAVDINWPLWKENKTLLWFKTLFSNDYIADSFRGDHYAVLAKLAAAKVLRQ